jgi:acyl-CoA synthetase (AMP-forming)/AMP-acid ligase II
LAAAVVVLEPGVALTTEDLEDHCRRELAGYKRPRRLQLAAELPLTASGKPAREEVRRLLLDSAA